MDKPSEEMAPDMAGDKDKSKSKDAGKQSGEKKDPGKDRNKDKSSLAATPDGSSGLKVGEAVPNLELHRLDGKTVQLSSYKNRVLVLVFGSYSTPTFRQQAAALEQLKKENDLRAEFTIVYTREAHPAGSREVERNRDDSITVEPARDDADRKEQAKKAKDALHLTIPIALDTMDDTLANTFGAFPNGAVVIGRDGTIFAKQRWFQPYTLGLAIEQASSVRVASTQGIR